MENPLRKQIRSIMKDHKKRQMWYRIVTTLAVVVVFVTTYMLILPAITMENKAECGITEHKHDANCYSSHYEKEKELACTTDSLGVHKHIDACYDAEHKLICGYADFLIHEHDASCYDKDGNLVCTIPEHKLHQHTPECYQMQKQLVCTQEESVGHTHTPECYTKQQGALICGKEEHTHGEGCYDAEGNLICTLEEHTHSDECYEWNDVLTCTIPESAGHTHSEACYQDVQVLICEEPAELHTHTAECYKDGVLACGKLELKEHKHSETCFTEKQVLVETLICDRVEHVHTDECYKKSTEETATSEEVTAEEASSQVEETSTEEASTEENSSEEASIEETSTEETSSQIEEASSEADTDAEETSLEAVSEEESEAESESEPEESSSIEAESEEESSEEVSTEEESSEEENFEETSTEETSEEELTSEEESTEENTSEAEEESSELPKLTGFWPMDMMEVAHALVGSTKHDLVKFCLDYIGISDMGYDSDLTTWIDNLTELNLYSSREDLIPSPGDVIFFDNDGDGIADHVGIITDVTEKEEDGQELITVAQSNHDGLVEEQEYQTDDERIVGQGSIIQNDYPNYAPIQNGTMTLENDVNLADYITSIEMKKKNGDNYVDASEFQDGDQVKVSLEYKVEHGKITQEKRTLIYQLPDGVRPNQSLSGNIKGTIAGAAYDNLGDYTIDTDGKITITFNDTFFTTDGEFIGGIDFSGTASLDNSSESKEIKFTADGKTYTIKPKPKDSDLTIKKTRSEAEDGKIIYTITASSKRGTDGETVKIVDKLSYSGLDKVTVGKPKVTKDNVEVDYTDSDYTSKSSSGSNEYTLKLPPLNAGETYTVSYEVDYGKVVGDGSASIWNEANGYKGDTWKSKDQVNAEISKQMIRKSGSATDNNQAIEWTIDVNPNHLSNVAGEYTIVDLLNGQKIDLSKAENFKIIETDTKNGWKQTDVTDTAYKDGKLTVKDGCSYSITYKTKIEYGNSTSVTYHNEAKAGDYKTGTDVRVSKSDLFKEKKTANNQKLLEDGTTVQQEWTIVLNPEKDTTDSFTVTDVMTDNSGSINENLHYTTKALLDESFFKYFLKKKIQYKLTCYDANGKEVTDEQSRVVRFILELNPQGNWSGDAINISYKSLFSVADLKDGETVTVRNTATVGNVFHDANASYTKKKRLFKYVYAKDQHGNYGWRSGSWKVDFNEANGQLKYKIVVFPDSTKEFTVIDTLPDGLTLKPEDVEVKFLNSNSWEYPGDSGYDITAEANKPEITVDGQKLTIKFKGGFPEKFSKGDYGFAINYTVTVTDEFWKNPKTAEKTYTNIAGWNGKLEPQETTIERHVPILAKDGEQLIDEKDSKPSNEVKYYIIINAAGEKLNNGKPLTLTDTLSADGLSVALPTENVKLYSYDPTKASNHYKGEELSASAFQFQYNEAEKKFTVIVPDETPCVLEYVYEIENMNDKASATFSNSASLSGVDESTTSKSITVKEAESSAWVKKSDQLQLVKVDADRYQITLADAEFKVQKYENPKWTEVEGTYTTGQNGTCIINLKNLARDNLYGVKESKAPDGYALSDEIYYFVALSNGKTADKWYEENKQIMSSLGIAKGDITFVEYSGFKELYIPNKSSSLKVTKLWRNPDGSPAQGTKNITVRLYQNTTKKEFYTVTVEFIGHNNNKGDWGSLEYQVKPNTKFILKMIEWSSSFEVWLDGKVGTAPSQSNEAKFDCGNVTGDTTIQVGVGWNGFNKEYYCQPIYTPADYVVDKSIPYDGDPITLTSANGYVGRWTDLPSVDKNGAPVYYTVKEDSNLGGYTVSYLNNDGIQYGEITIINKKNEETITLPETGGTGTYWYTMGGVLLTAGAAFLIYKKHMQKGGKRIW